MDPRAEEPIVIGSAPGTQAWLLPTGAAVQRLLVTGGDGIRRDVALGLADGAAVRASPDYVGVVVGRYANRIAHGRLRLDDLEYALPLNDRAHHLHGGPQGFHTRDWTISERTQESVTFELVSPDGDQGYPGQLVARAAYRVEETALHLLLTAETSAPTVVNLTSHLYLNLAGPDDHSGWGGIDDHLLSVPATRFVDVDQEAIPRGQNPVVGTPFDLNRPTRLGDVLQATDPRIETAGGLDHDLVVDGQGRRRVATLNDPSTSTRMTLWADQPGLQVYTANGFDGSALDRSGRPLRRHAAVALEPQRHPDTPRHGGEPGWPTAVLRPGEVYSSRITWSFGPTG